MRDPTDKPLATDGAKEAALEEIADDMLQLLRRVNAVEQRVTRLSEQADELAAQIGDGALATARAIDRLHRELVGDRRAMAVRGVFDVTATALDSLRAMAHGLDPAQDERMLRQLAGVVSVLNNLVQGLGYAEYDVQPGEPFDPARMRCLGYAPGPSGVVLTALQSGYAAGEVVARPAGVLIADPAATEQQSGGA